MITIPMIDAPSFKFSLVLSVNEYQLKLDWNSYGSFWSMAILDLDDEILLCGIKIVIGYPLLLQRGYSTDLPSGDFWCIDTSLESMFDEPGRYDFVKNRKLELIYIGDDE
jgi:hypothetical protein